MINKTRIISYFFTCVVISAAVFSFSVYAVAATASATVGGQTSATLALSPASGPHNTGDIFSMNIMLDTHGSAVQGVDIISLHYNPALLEVQDEDAGTSGVQIAPGALMQNTVFNAVDSGAGTVTFSQLTASGGSFTGSGSLAIVRFKALAAGTAAVTFDFTPGNTADTNVASNGSDILASVTNASYVISGNTVPQQQDTTPPVRSQGTPSGVLSAGVTQIGISLSTNENATCKYGATAGVGYLSASNTFSVTNGTTHSAVITGLTQGASYKYYVRCIDGTGNANTDDYAISFSVTASTPTPAPTPVPAPVPAPTPTPSPTPTSGGFIPALTPTTPAPVVSQPQSVSVQSSPFLPAGVSEGDLVRGPDGIKVYIVNQHGFKRHIFNPAVFSMYGHFKWDQIKSLSQQEIDTLKVSDLYRADGDTRVFSLHELDESKGFAQKRWLSVSAEKFIALGYAWNQVFIINAKERDYYQEGSPITDSSQAPQPATVSIAAGSLVKTASDPTVYYITNTGLKKRIINAAVFNSYNNRWENIKTVSQSQLDAYPTANTIKLSTGVKVYLLERDMKRWVKTADAFARLGFDWGKVTVVNQTELNAYAEGASIE